MSQIISILAALCLLLACHKKGDPSPAQQENTRGSIHGTVKHYNYEGLADTLTLNATTVVIEPLNKNTVTDSLGHYEFTSVPPGVYTLNFLRPETGFNKQTEIVVDPGATVRLDAALHDTASWFITKVALSDSLWQGELHLMVTVMVPAMQKQLYAEMYFSKKTSIDPLDRSTYSVTSPLILPYAETSSCWPIPYSWLKANGFNTGEKCFLNLFPTNPNAGYKNKSNNTWVCTGTGRPYPTIPFPIP